MYLNFILMAFPEVIILLFIFARLSEIKLAKLEWLATYACVTAMFILNVAVFPHTDIFRALTNALMVAPLVTVAYLKTKNPHLAIFYGVFSSIIMLVGGGISFGAFMLLMPAHFFEARSYLLESWQFSVFYYLMSAGVTLAVLYSFIKLFYRNIKLLDGKSMGAMSRFLSVGSVLLYIPFLLFSFLSEPERFYTVLPVVPPLSLLIFFILLSFSIMTVAGSMQKDESLKNLEEYTRSVENIATAMRRFRHDHLNLLLGFNEFFAKNDLSGLEDYHKKYMQSFRAETMGNQAEVQKLNKLEYPVLKGLVSAKLIFAQQLDINVSIDIPTEIKIKAGHSMVDICRIVGNLLDNAIEFCMDAPGSRLGFGAAATHAGVSFVVENTFSSPPPIDEMFKEGYSTKGEGRGIGLYTVSQILKKNPALLLETKTDAGNFIQLLTVKV